MAIIKRETNKGFVYDVIIRDLGGKQRWKTFSKKKDAEQFERFVLDKKHRDEFPEVFDPKKRINFSELAKKWLELHSKPNKAPKSYVKDRGVCYNYLIPHFSNTLVQRITTEQVQEYLTYRLQSICSKTKRSVSPNTVNRELEIIRKMFNDGIKWGYLRQNPCKGIKKFKEKSRRTEFLSEKEVRNLLNNVLSSDLTLFATAIYTGMRFGELANLEKKHVDLKKGLITVEIGSEESGTTKSGKIRYIPIATALKPHIKEALSSSGKLLFPSKRGPDIKRTEATKALEGALKRAGIKRHIRFHDLRHTFASHFVMRGGDLLALKELLGHSDLQMVQRYAHLAPDHLRGAIDRLDFSVTGRSAGDSEGDK